MTTNAPEVLIREYKDAWFAANLRDIDIVVVYLGRGWYELAGRKVRAKAIEEYRDRLLDRARLRAAQQLVDDAMDEQLERGER